MQGRTIGYLVSIINLLHNLTLCLMDLIVQKDAEYMNCSVSLPQRGHITIEVAPSVFVQNNDN